MGEIAEAVQVINVAYDGVNIAMKVGSATVDKLKKAVELIVLLLNHEKSMGKTSLRKLLEKGGDLQVFQFDDKDIRKFKKLAKKYGILYSELPDMNKKDGMTEILFHSEAVPRINLLIQKMNSGQISTFDEYIKNCDELKLDNLLNFLRVKKNEETHTDEVSKAAGVFDGLIQKIGLFVTEKQTVSVDMMRENFDISEPQAEKVMRQFETIGLIKGQANGEYKVVMDKEAFLKRLKGYQELADRMQAISESKKTNLVDITIARKMIEGETEEAIKTRIPYEKDKYIWIPRDKIMEVNEGKTILTFLNKEEEYSIVDMKDNEVSRLKGDELYKKSYDPVNAGLSAKYRDKEKKEILKKRAMMGDKPVVMKR